MLNLLRLNSLNTLVCRSSKTLRYLRSRSRSLADSAHTDLTTSKQLIQGTENEQRVRVRRARTSDVPRVLRFVREHSRIAWPSLVSAPVAPTTASQLVLSDYVARALAQGHTMMAEQVASRRGWLTVRGLALGSAVCPWDAHVLDRWARCMRDKRSRRLVNFTAHCLRGPALHDKYGVQNILQVILIVSPESRNCQEIVQMLAKSAIQRGREVGFPLLRFDVTSESVAKALEDLNLKREWYLAYDVLPTEDALIEDSTDENSATLKRAAEINTPMDLDGNSHFIAVYTASTTTEPQITAPGASEDGPKQKQTC